MKTTFSKTIGTAALAILLLATCAQIRVSAQGKGNGSLQNGNEQGLVGSWNLLVTLRDCQTGTEFVTFPAMNTYNQGGTTQQAAPAEPGSASLPGHGVWSHQTARRYSSAFQFFTLNLAGALTGRVIVRSAISLGRGGNDYTSTDTAEVLNTNGDVVIRACSTTTATRFE